MTFKLQPCVLGFAAGGRADTAAHLWVRIAQRRKPNIILKRNPMLCGVRKDLEVTNLRDLGVLLRKAPGQVRDFWNGRFGGLAAIQSRQDPLEFVNAQWAIYEELAVFSGVAH